MNRTSTPYLLVALLFAGLAVGSSAAEPETCPIEPNTALVDAIVKKLESDGALDRAVEKSLQRLIKRQQAEQNAEESRRQAALAARAGGVRPPTAGRDHIRGNPAADISIIEYSDFECPFCKRFHEVPALMLSRFGGRVNWVLRHFPLAFHEPAAGREAAAAECAAQLGGNDAFWTYSDALFRQTRSNGQGLPGEKPLLGLAGSLGLNEQAFAECLRGDRATQRVRDDMREGSEIGISGTPTSMIRDNRTGNVVPEVGAVAPDVIDAQIRQLLGERH